MLKCPTKNDMPIKAFYAKLFPEVFISLKPFAKIKAGSSQRETANKWSSADTRQNMTAITWKEISELSGLSTINIINEALMTGSGSLEEDQQNEAASDQLFDALESHRIMPPDEDHFSSFDLERVLMAIRACGYPEVTLDDEWGSLGSNAPKLELTVPNIQALNNDDLQLVEWGVMSIYTADHQLLFVSPYDKYYSLLCGSKEMLEKIIASANLEGFYADETTTLNLE